MLNSAVRMLDEAAARWGDRLAVAEEGASLTYGEYRALARRVATSILQKGADRRPVVVYLPKGIRALCTFMGAMCAGCPYAPVDAHAPPLRLEKIVDSLRPGLIVTDAALAESLGGIDLHGATVCLYDELAAAETDEAAVDRATAAVTAQDPIYIMYTSGSTGTPKGVTIPHRGVLLFADWARAAFGWTCDTVIANQAPLYFDVSVMDVYGALACGGCLILTPEALFLFPSKLPEFLRDNAVTHIYWVPTVMINIANSGALDGIELPSLRTVAFAGEVMPNKQLNVWRRALPGRVFANLYGPTETDVCTAYFVDRPFADAEPLPIGTPLPGMGVVLLDEGGRAVAPGQTGEICVSGPGILLGYWNNDEQTRLAFVSGPEDGGRYYRTGDLGWWNERGELMYSGRRDGQIKLRGNRIELGEIEAAARLLPGTDNVCVLFDRPRQQIVLFVESAAELTMHTVRKALRGAIPPYMMPGRVVTMDKLPHNANDKIDRVYLSKWLEEN